MTENQILALKERGETLITILNWINDRQKCEIMAHIDRKAHTIIPDVEDSLIADELYSDILQMVLREAGVNNMDSINTKYLASIHEAIDTYQIPECLREQTTIPR